MTRARDQQSSWPFLLALHDAALLLALFLVPIYWGAFNTNVAALALGNAQAGLGGLTITTFCVTVAALATLAWRGLTRSRPAVLPNAIHLPALLLVAISAVALLTSVNVYASVLEVTRLGIGALLFVLIANRALLPAAPRELTLGLFAAGLPLVFFTAGVGEEAISAGWPTFSWLDILVCVAGAGGVALWLSPRQGSPPVRRGLEALLLSAGVVSVWAIREKIVMATVLNNPSWPPMSTFFNQNALGGFLAVLLPVAVVVAVSARSFATKLTFAAVSSVMACALVFTVSKGAFVGLFAAALVGAVLLARMSRNPRRTGRLVVAGLLLLVLMAAAPIVAVPSVRSKAVSAFGTGNASNMFRLLTWTGTWHMALDHPWLGVGPGAFESIFGKYTIAGFTKAAHQAYLQTAAEQGFAGLLILLWLFGAVLFTGWRVVGQAARPAADRLLAVGLLGGLVVLLVHNLLDNNWYIGAVGVSFWLMAGVLAHLAHGREVEAASRPAETDAPKGKRRKLGEAVVPKPTRDREVRSLPWPPTTAGRAVAILVCAGLLISLVSFTMHSDWAQQAQSDGEKALGLFNYLSASAQARDGDPATIQKAQDYFRQALERYRSAATNSPLWAGGHETYARMLEGVRDTAAAEQEYKTAIDCAPESYQYRLSRAHFYDMQDRWSDAARAYEDALKYFPYHTRALRYLAVMYQRKGEEANALGIYRRLLAAETQPINTVRAIDAQTNIDDSYAYAHYEVGRSELQTLRRTHDPKLFASIQAHFVRVLGVVADYRAGGNRLDKIYKQLNSPRTDRTAQLALLEAKARLRLAEAFALIGQPKEAEVQRAAAAQVFANDPAPAQSFTAVAQAVEKEDAGGRP